ncbi:hypothetical protein ACTFIW_003633 [Dictyostelium discoideum]
MTSIEGQKKWNNTFKSTNKKPPELWPVKIAQQRVSGIPTTHSFASYTGENELIQFEEGFYNTDLLNLEISNLVSDDSSTSSSSSSSHVSSIWQDYEVVVYGLIITTDSIKGLVINAKEQRKDVLLILELTWLYDTNSQPRKPHSGDSVFIKNEGKHLDVKDIGIIVLSTLSSSGIDIILVQVKLLSFQLSNKSVNSSGNNTTGNSSNSKGVKADLTTSMDHPSNVASD